MMKKLFITIPAIFASLILFNTAFASAMVQRSCGDDIKLHHIGDSGTRDCKWQVGESNNMQLAIKLKEDGTGNGTVKLDCLFKPVKKPDGSYDKITLITLKQDLSYNIARPPKSNSFTITARYSDRLSHQNQGNYLFYLNDGGPDFAANDLTCTATWVSK